MVLYLIYKYEYSLGRETYNVAEQTKLQCRINEQEKAYIKFEQRIKERSKKRMEKRSKENDGLK